MAAPLCEPPLTVAIPTYNGAAHLALALRSIIDQDGVAFELIVSDDHSDDNTLDVVRAVAGDRARVDAHGERLGLAGNWNRCAALCRTPSLAIFHQDDVMKPGHLKAHAAALAADERLGLVASASEMIDERGGLVPPTVVDRGGLGPIDRTFEPRTLAAEMSLGNPLRCSAVTMRLAAFTDVGGFDPSYRYVLDWDFWLRVSRRWGVAWLATPTVQVRWHAASETHRLKTGTADLDETGQFLERLFAIDLQDRSDAARLRHAANLRLGRALLNRAYDALHAGDSELARDCLRRAVHRSRGVITTLLGDPRFGFQMAALAVAPRTAIRWFKRKS
ncbi:MAG TPA: glycosyltransferase [Isosphaeraceae bacterium]|nr:glycosyltransferase [Isosphaeraceae bacterium]